MYYQLFSNVTLNRLWSKYQVVLVCYLRDYQILTIMDVVLSYLFPDGIIQHGADVCKIQ